MPLFNYFESKENPGYFIAEVGGNHEGDFEYAIELCDLAIASGADAVKFQLYQGDKLVSRVSSPDRNAHFKKFELSRDQHIQIAERVRASGRDYMASVWDEEMLSWIDPYISIHKVGSGDLTHYSMLKTLVRTGKPVIVSTGLSSMDEIRSMVRFIASIDASYLSEQKLALLQCTSAYPLPDTGANLRTIPTLIAEFNLPVGYSDHTVGTGAIDLAYGLGARIFEKHFTDDREGKTFRDHLISLTGDELKSQLENLRRTEKLLGSEIKALTEEEASVEHEISFRRSLHAARNLKSGALLKEGDFEALRPCVGIPATRYFDLEGKKLRRDLNEHDPIMEDDIEW